MSDSTQDEGDNYTIHRLVSIAAIGSPHARTAYLQGDSQCVNDDGSTYAGRKCAELVSRPFRLIESDMYNFVPALPSVSSKLQGYYFGSVYPQDSDLGSCKMYFDESGRYKYAEPTDAAKGWIARTLMYMKSLSSTLNARQHGSYFSHYKN